MSSLKRLAVLVLGFTVIAARAQAGSLTLAWDANTEPDIAGYLVAYGLQPGVYTGHVDVGLTTTTTISLSDGARYYFAVSAYNTAGQYSDPSAEISAYVGSMPTMSVDTPANGATVSTAGFVLGGWAVDLGSHSGAGVDAMHVWAYPDTGAAPLFVTALPYGSQRDDVAAAFGTQFLASGYTGQVSTLPAGGYNLVVYAHSTVAGTFNDARMLHVTVAAPVSRPYISIDTPRANDTRTGSFTVSGWAVDLASVSGCGIDAVHVWAVPLGSAAPATFVGIASTGGARPDVGGILGAQFTNSGFGVVASGLAPGSYRLVVYAHSVLTGTFNAASTVDVIVR